MSKFAASLAIATALLSASAVAETAKPTVVLVHGAFADSSSWNGVTRILQKDGYNVVAAANPSLFNGCTFVRNLFVRDLFV